MVENATLKMVRLYNTEMCVEDWNVIDDHTICGEKDIS